MTGEKFELEVYDGDSENATKLTLANQWTGVNQVVTPVSSSGHAIYVRFRYSGRNGASVRFTVTDDRGRKNVKSSAGEGHTAESVLLRDHVNTQIIKRYSI